MMWRVQGQQQSLDALGDLEPIEVLYDFEGPRIFTTKSSAGDLFLAYQCGEDEEFRRYLLVPASSWLVQEIREGAVAIRDALDQPWSWMVDISHDNGPTFAWRVDVKSLPQNVLPRPGTLLLPSMRPLLSVRMVGEGLSRDGVPASVIRRVVDGVSSSLKLLVEWVLQETHTTGRPEERLRRYYDLPAQRFAFNSFEVTFGPPPSPSQTTLLAGEEAALEHIGNLLGRGVAWAAGTTEAGLPNELPSGEETRVLLEALLKLSPPKHGVVTEVHLQGKLVGGVHRPRILTRAATDKVRRRLETVRRDVRPVSQAGVIREFDKDKMTFTLRTPDGEHLSRCTFGEPLYDDALAAFDADEMVIVAGYESSSRGIVDVVSIVAGPSNSETRSSEP